MKKLLVFVLFITIALSMAIFSAQAMAAEKQKQKMVVEEHINHNDLPYTVYFYGVEGEEPKELRNKKEKHYNLEKYLDKVKFPYKDSRPAGWKWEEFPLLYYGETYRLFYEASYDKKQAWKNFIVKEIVIEFSDDSIKKYQEEMRKVIPISKDAKQA